jgi:hypothetical protein
MRPNPADIPLKVNLLPVTKMWIDYKLLITMQSSVEFVRGATDVTGPVTSLQSGLEGLSLYDLEM